MPVKELCRKHGFRDASLYTWRAKFAGMYSCHIPGAGLKGLCQKSIGPIEGAGQALLDDLLKTRDNDAQVSGEIVDETRSATERARASVTGTIEPMGASEERNAAMEAESMKALGR